MADVKCAIYGDSDDWDGTNHWGMDEDGDWLTTEAARDAIYTAGYASLSDWETARDGVANAADDEYAIIFGAWTSHDTNEFSFDGWTNKPAHIIIKTVGTDARSQDGKFDSNSCYVLEADSELRGIDIDEAGFNISITGVQFYITNTSSDTALLMDNDGTLTVDKCFFYENGDQGAKGVRIVASTTITFKITNSIFRDFGEQVKGLAGSGTAKVYNCTVIGSAQDAIEDDGGTWTVKNCAVFNNTDDFEGSPDTIDFCASDQGAGEGTNGLDISSTWNTTCFTDQANGDYSIESDSPLKDASDISQADDSDVPDDDIIGTARNTGAGETVDIGAYAYPTEAGSTTTTTSTHSTTSTSSTISTTSSTHSTISTTSSTYTTASSTSSTASTTSSTHSTTSSTSSTISTTSSTHSTTSSTYSTISTTSSTHSTTSSTSSTISTTSSTSSTISTTSSTHSTTTSTFSTISTTSSTYSTTSSTASTISTTSSTASTISTTSSSYSTTSSTASTTSSTYSTSSTTTTVLPPLGYAFGEENPIDENPESWATWSDGAAGSPEIIGDADWGQLKIEEGEVGHSAVKDLGSTKNRMIVLTRDKYGSGSGNINMYIRGQATSFTQDAGSPAWEEYTVPVKKDWRYIQVKTEYSA